MMVECYKPHLTLLGHIASSTSTPQTPKWTVLVVEVLSLPTNEFCVTNHWNDVINNHGEVCSYCLWDKE
jgi:hypothetical protein